jgi:hypothetical protein
MIFTNFCNWWFSKKQLRAGPRGTCVVHIVYRDWFIRILWFLKIDKKGKIRKNTNFRSKSMGSYMKPMKRYFGKWLFSASLVIILYESDILKTHRNYLRIGVSHWNDNCCIMSYILRKTRTKSCLLRFFFV